MPQKNTIKEYTPDSYYHVYTRGANRQKIFLEASDYHYFISLLARYLQKQRAFSKTGVPYPNYSQEVRLLSYCLMTNHIHMLLYQKDDIQALRKLMSSLMTSYSKYFNHKYSHVGVVFESRYKAKRIDNNSYLAHISRYIHMNPRRWQNYSYSSLRFIFSPNCPKWLAVEEVTNEFKSRDDYLYFLADYQENKDHLEIIKYQLADM